ncbi:3892_t:CDS:2 [Ambispora gerdemannii]|uniref:3892_t:CDS:1 n=1 Tax=Ambispora gerdemannii TaxID=144530 RepID=A0A9N8VMA3_9GLOM|nr:3892_t:CDS:2 [Ambispora gerdemannii]
MTLKIGLVGLPNVGKSSLFHYLTKKDILIANYPFATIDPNVGVMPLIDPRLEDAIEIVDIAGLVKGASQNLGLGNEFLSHIREKQLEKETPVSQLDLSEEEKELIKGYNFLTSKPIFLLANYGGEEKEIAELREYAKKKELSLFPLAVKLEGEMEELSTEEKEEMG